MVIYDDKDRFQYWHYQVSHGFLLIRSPKNESRLTNKDLVFSGVEYSELPSVLNGLKVELLDIGMHDFSKRVSFYPERFEDKSYVITSGRFKYYILASHCKVIENHLDFFELPFD